MRILQLAATDYSFHVHLMPLLDASRARGHDVSCAGAAGPFVDEVRRAGFRYFPLPLRRSLNALSHARVLAIVVKLLRSERIELLHSHALVAGLIGRTAARLAGTPLSVYTAHGFRFHDRMAFLPRNVLLRAERWGARHSDFLFVQNPEDRITAVAHRFLPPERVLTIGSGIDLTAFSPKRDSDERLDELRAELDLPHDARVVTTIARPTREKGVRAFYELAERVSARRNDVHFLAVLPELHGERSSIAKELEGRGGPRMRRLEFRRDIPQLLRLSDVFVLPSEFEGVSRVVMEAMASGVPVVATNVRGCRQLVRPGETGYLYEPGDVRKLDELVEHLLEPGVADAMGVRAYDVARRELDQRRSIELQLDVFERLATGDA